MRKATAKMMDENYEKIVEHIDATTFPFFMVDKIKELGVNGLNIKGYGSPGLTTLESAAPTFEMARRDGSVSTFFLVHNSIGMAVVNALGDDE